MVFVGLVHSLQQIKFGTKNLKILQCICNGYIVIFVFGENF